MKKIIVVLGLPCSGKDTHAKLLANKLNYKYCSSNDIIAEEIKNKTKIGLIMEKYLNSRTSAPDEYLIMLIKEIIINLKEDGIIFNNFPQTVNQAKALDSFLFTKKTNRPIPIFLEADLVTILNRVTEKLESKEVDSFKNTMNFYEKKTKPIIDYYTAIMSKFDTSKDSIDKINEEIMQKIK